MQSDCDLNLWGRGEGGKGGRGGGGRREISFTCLQFIYLGEI